MSALELSLRAVSQQLAQGAISSVALTEASLERIAKLEPRVHAFLTVDEAGAMKAARESDERRRQGQSRGPLDGVPLALKDNICTAGLRTTAASKILGDYVPPADATVTARLRSAGSVILGKTNLDEFGMGSSTEASAFGPTANPYDLTRTPGGSSGGSAAAVAARTVFGAIGTDTGGSIRQPAAFTNIVGLKPTYGRVSRLGVVAYASSLDQVGPMARTVDDARLLYEQIAGFDANDSTSADRPVGVATPSSARLEGVRIGLPAEYFVTGIEPETEAAIRALAKRCTELGAKVVDVSLPYTTFALPAYYVIATAEASSNLARYDGVRYGHRAAEPKNLRELYERSRAEGFGDEVKRRILLGTFALSAGYADAYYRQAQRVRALIRRDFEQVFASVDVVLSATSPGTAWLLGSRSADPLAMYLMDALTIPCNLAGLPGLSLPAGFSSQGMPIGAQLLAKPWQEDLLLRVAGALERPDLFARRPEVLNAA